MTAATDSLAKPVPQAMSLRGRLPRIVRRFAVWLTLALLLVVGTIMSPVFLTPSNLLNVLGQSSIVGIAAIGTTYVGLLGGVDVSNAAVLTAAAVAAAAVMQGRDGAILPALAVAIVLGALVGFLNGLLIARWRVNPLILTLGVGAAILGATELYTGGTDLGNVATGFTDALGGRIGAVPILGLVFLALAALGILIQRTTVFGSRLYLVGANPRAAALSGVQVNAVIIGAYVASGITASLAGLAFLARSGPPSDFTGMGLEFQVLAAIVLGGTTFAGGIGGIGGTVAGALALALSFNLVNIIGLGTGGQLIVQGAVIVGIAALYSLVRPRQ